MDLYTCLKPECCTVDLQAADKEQVLRELVRLAVRNPAARQAGEENIYQQLLNREKQGTTGFGDGIAIPHARVEGLEEFVVGVAIAPRGVEFDAMDRKKCRILLFILAPASAVGEHLKVLAAVSHAVKTGARRNELLKAPSAVALYESFMRGVVGTSIVPASRRNMKLLILVLYIEDFIYDIMELVLKAGIDGATILESSGMGSYISNVPLFAEFIGFMQERKNKSTTILAMIPEEREQEIVAGIEAITGDMATRQGAMIMTMDVSFFKGSMQMM